MKFLFYFGHPAQYLFLRSAIKTLISKNHEVLLLIKSKDVLEDLLSTDNLEYINILPTVRGKSKFSILMSLLKRLVKILPIIQKHKPDLMISTDASIAQLGFLLNINRITITEDDYDIIKTLGLLTYPFTKTILCPKPCKVGRWEKKKLGYEGYMKLGYLHPNIFTPLRSVIDKYSLNDNYALIRLSALTAHHDYGIEGISEDMVKEIISMLEDQGLTVYISSEKPIMKTFEKYKLKINPSDMHHILSYAALLISDSQSMSMEAAMLGVPSLRYSSFAGKISVLEELEHTYQLTFGILPGKKEQLLKKINEILTLNQFKQEFQKRRNQMLADKIDVSSFLVWFLENYPQSETILRDTPDFQYQFK